MTYYQKYLKYNAKYSHLLNKINQNKQIESEEKDKQKDENNIIKIIFIRHGESTENYAVIEGKSYDKNNIILTNKGKNQAIDTGNYLKNIFNSFDYVYCSPAPRCKETCNLICQKINFPFEKVQINNLIVELGFHSNKLDGLDRIQRDELLNVSDLKNINEKLVNTKDPFKKYFLDIKYGEKKSKILNISPNVEEAKITCDKFLNNIKELCSKNKKINKILVVTHGGIIRLFQSIICNLDWYSQIQIISSKSKCDNFIENCSILSVMLNKNSFSLVEPSNINHLKIN